MVGVGSFLSPPSEARLQGTVWTQGSLRVALGYILSPRLGLLWHDGRNFVRWYRGATLSVDSNTGPTDERCGLRFAARQEPSPPAA